MNIPGIENDQLKLTGELLADIYLGKITKWNDARMAELNAGLTLPNLAIAPVYRADGSGTTFVFTSYLVRGLAGLEEQGRRRHLGALAGRHGRQRQ